MVYLNQLNSDFCVMNIAHPQKCVNLFSRKKQKKGNFPQAYIVENHLSSYFI